MANCYMDNTRENLSQESKDIILDKKRMRDYVKDIKMIHRKSPNHLFIFFCSRRELYNFTKQLPEGQWGAPNL